METKTCTKCGQEKPLTDFNFKNKALGRRQAMCKECQRARERELYGMSYKQKNKDRYTENRKKYRERMRSIIQNAKSKGCIICGETESCCLDFHHLYNKEFVIAGGTEVSEERLLQEISKCVVLCANCHRKLHAGKINLLKYMNVNFKKLDPRAVAPVRAHESDAGFDLVATQITTEINECGQLILVYHTGLAVEIPNGYFAMLVPRSSIFKKSLALTNSPGVIDSGYRGEILGKFKSTTDVVPAVYKDGERFAQLLILPCPDVTFTETSELSNSDRGEEGYGSTGDSTIESAPTGPVETPVIEEEMSQEAAPEVAAGTAKDPEQAE